MAARTASYYAKHSFRPDLKIWSRHLGKLGLTFEHPRTGEVYRLDSFGEQLATSIEEIQAMMDLESDVSFQLWFAADHDLYCRIRCTAGVRVLELGMEGTTPTERRKLERWLLLCALDAGRGDELLGLVFDPDGNYEEYDWDRLFIRGEAVRLAAYSEREPVLLVLSAAMAERVEAGERFLRRDGLAYLGTDASLLDDAEATALPDLRVPS